MKGLDYHIAYGLHSNIPACCIVFWLTEWTKENERDSAYAQTIHMDLVQYVPCPECFALQRFNGIRICQRDCWKDCYKEFLEREPTAREHMEIRSVKLKMDMLQTEVTYGFGYR